MTSSEKIFTKSKYLQTKSNLNLTLFILRLLMNKSY